MKGLGSLSRIWPLLAIAAAIGCRVAPAPERPPAALPALIPWPAEIERTGGFFDLLPDTAIVHEAGLERAAALAAVQLGLRGPVDPGRPRDGAISLVLDRALKAEGYACRIDPSGIAISGGSPAGVMFGVQTLRQLAGPAPVTGRRPISGLIIRDRPRFAWRGLMLDCSRTFQSIAYLKATIDRLLFYKMNVLHLHLTDEQGWRMEIRRYPELTRKGARFDPKYNEPESHQGFYTQAELKELVVYAAERGVTLVPEIEMPSHCIAALVCRPDLACPGPFLDEIMPYVLMSEAAAKDPARYPIFCAGNEDTITFLENVLDEVAEVFPSKTIHIGGDEAPKIRWKACPKCQARMRAEGLKDEDGLQSWFVRRIERHLASRGRRLIGWDEILEGGLAPGAAVMSWRGTAGGKAAAEAGHEVVMSPTSHCYFDYSYEAIDAKKAYGFDPLEGISPAAAPHVLGLQANFWSHLDREPALVDKQIFPRLLALAERGWSKAAAAEWAFFEPRLTAHFEWLRRFGVSYFAGPVKGAQEKP